MFFEFTFNGALFHTLISIVYLDNAQLVAYNKGNWLRIMEMLR